MFNNKLELTDENGIKQIINVIDILDDNEFNKQFIIYYLEGDNDNIYSSILNEQEDTFTLDPIVIENEIDYINLYINKMLSDK